MTGPDSMIELLEQCLPLMEARYLRCFYGEPWCPLTMCGAIMLLKMHAGQESVQTAKSSCAQRFLCLYYKHFRRQGAPVQNLHYPPGQEASNHLAVSTQHRWPGFL
jgi:hypothetical protein